MNPVLAFVVVMLVWTISDWVAKKTKSLLSSLFVASIIFLIGFMTGIFPTDLLQASSLLGLAGVVVGFIIVHLGTMISLDDFKKQWKTLLIGIATVIGIGVLLLAAGAIFGGGPRNVSDYGDLIATGRDFAIAGIGALSGGTISVLIIQEAALGIGLTTVAAFPVLIAALQGLFGFPLTSLLLRREAARLKDEYRAGRLEAPVAGGGRPRGGGQAAVLPADDPRHPVLRRRGRPAQHRHQQPHQRHAEHVRRRPDPRHRAAQHRACSSRPCSPASTRWA